MGFFDFLKPQQYDMDTLDGIMSIPVPAKNYNTGNPTKDYIYYVLQRKATEHKKNGKLDLAIACLRKSNQLSDYEERPLLSSKEYLRLLKFLEDSNDAEGVSIELETIRKKNPSYIGVNSENQKLATIKSRFRGSNEDTVIALTSRLCPKCSIYNRRIFSIFGRDKRFLLLPTFLEKTLCPICCVHISFSHYFLGITGNLKADIINSTKPLVDSRTEEEKNLWNEKVEKITLINKLEQDYNWILANIPTLAPKSLGGYKRMVSTKSSNYRLLAEKASDKGYTI